MWTVVHLNMGLTSFPSFLLELFFILRKWHRTETGDCGVRMMWIRLSSVTHQNLNQHAVDFCGHLGITRGFGDKGRIASRSVNEC